MFMEKIKQYCIDAFFPKQCIGCGIFGYTICTECISINMDIHCTSMNIEGSALQHIISIGNYANPFWKKSIRALKYSSVTDIGIECGLLLGTVIENSIAIQESDTICIPIPIHSKKRLKRGYNQCDYIAQGLSTVLSIPFETDILIRHSHTVSQTELSDEERIANMKNVFSLSKQSTEQLLQKHIILIDDVFTTGATCLEAVKTLQNAGAERITIATIARGR